MNTEYQGSNTIINTSAPLHIKAWENTWLILRWWLWTVVRGRGWSIIQFWKWYSTLATNNRTWTWPPWAAGRVHIWHGIVSPSTTMMGSSWTPPNWMIWNNHHYLGIKRISFLKENISLLLFHPNPQPLGCPGTIIMRMKVGKLCIESNILLNPSSIRRKRSILQHLGMQLNILRTKQ